MYHGWSCIMGGRVVDVSETRQALEHLRASTYNKKLGMIRQQEAADR